METLSNGSFTSPLANANLQLARQSDSDGLLSSLYNVVSGWSAVLAVFLALVAYDQGRLSSASNLLVTIANESGAVSYKWQKGSLIGPAWKIPFMGPFLESVYPKFTVYKAKWASGTLSCVSVFHK